jgi:hypothetical protein
MINQTSLISPINAAKGQFVQFSLSYQSTVPLVGQLLEVNLAPFTNQLLPNPAVYAYQVPYTIGTQDMNFVLPSDKNRNFRIEFEAITSTTFRLNFELFMVSDLDGFVSDVVFDNTLTFENEQGNASSSIYTALQKNLWVALRVGQFTRNTPVPFLSSTECSDSLVLEQPTFVEGQNLTLTFQSPLLTDFEYYVLIYNESQVQNGLNFVQDLQINYARIDNQVNSVATLPSGAFLSGTGFINGQAQLEINGAFLQAVNDYVIIPIYRHGGTWRSCRINLRAGETGFQPIVGDVTCRHDIQDFSPFGTSCCGIGIPLGEKINVEFTAQKASWNAQISTFFPGTFNDYFHSAKIEFSTQLPSSQPVLSTPASNLQVSQTSSQMIVTGSFTPPAVGVWYALLTIKMVYPTHEDIIVKPLRLSIFNTTQVLQYSLLDGDGNPVDSELCIQQDGDVTFSYTPLNVDTKLYYSLNGGAWIKAVIGNFITGISDGVVTFDADALSVNDSICFKLIVEGAGGQSGGGDDPSCDFCDDFINATVIWEDNPVAGTQQVVVNLPFSPDFGQWYLSQPAAPDTNGVLSQNTQIPIQLNFSAPVVLNIFVEIDDCFYSRTYIISQPNQLITEPVLLSGCNPQLLPIPSTCDNVASIIHQCLPDIATIDIAFTETFTSPVDDDIQEISLDGGATWIPAPLDVTDEPFIIIRRIVTFTDGCPTLNLYQTVTCIPETECFNSRLVEFTVDENDLLTITLTDDFNSSVDTDVVQVSLDGGLTFASYAAPIQLSGGEEVVITSLVTFDDNCPALTFQTSFINDITAQCDYDQFEFECVFAENTNTFTFDFDGDESLLEVNIKEYSLDGGVTWIPYVGAVNAEFILGRWTVKYENCEKHIIVRGCQSGCKKVEICSPVTVQVDGCVPICGDCDPESASKGLC